MKQFDINLLKDVIDDLKNNPDACKMQLATEVNGVISLGYTITGEKLREFFSYLFSNNLVDFDYGKNYELIKDRDIKDYSFENILTAMTRIYRGERFSNGFIYENYKDKTIQRLLERLYELLENM